jgi:hypothetical protein
MGTQVQSDVRSLEGLHVNMALRGGERIDDCQLISAGHGGVDNVWIYANGEDVFVPIADVMDLWETR